MMLQKLADYEAGSVPPNYPPSEPEEADPSKHGGSWEPWHWHDKLFSNVNKFNKFNKKRQTNKIF